MFPGMKRKTTAWTENVLPVKVAKTMAQVTPSTAARNVIDHRRPDLTFIDVPDYDIVLF
jgi:hypothetical protein